MLIDIQASWASFFSKPAEPVTGVILFSSVKRVFPDLISKCYLNSHKVYIRYRGGILIFCVCYFELRHSFFTYTRVDIKCLIKDCASTRYAAMLSTISVQLV